LRANFLVTDLTDRIAKGPVRFDIIALLGQPDDQTMDITVRWPDEDKRKGIKLGTVAVTAIEPNETCDAAIFDPANLPDGIGAPKDELFAARHEAYTISLRLRSH
jgi:catalase